MQEFLWILPMNPKNELMTTPLTHMEVVSRKLSGALNIAVDSSLGEKLGMMSSSTLLLPDKGLGRPHRQIKHVTARTTPYGSSQESLEGGLILLTRCPPEQTVLTL